MGSNNEVKIRISTDIKGSPEDLRTVENGLINVGKEAGKAGAALASSKPAMDSLGMSAKATAAALLEVPAQFTDIVTSLQGGQSPLTVLMQQGGQLKDMFGGVGAASRALGGYVLGLVNPFTITAASVAALGLAYYKGAQDTDAYNKAIIMSGNAAGVTADQLQGMAETVSKSTGASAGTAAEALAAFVANGNIGSAQMEAYAAVAVRMEQVLGVAVGDTVKQFAELAKDPVAASNKLNAATHYLTDAVRDQIRAAADQGDMAKASAIAQEAFAKAENARLDELVSKLGIVERAWMAVIAVKNKFVSDVTNVGRPDTKAEELAAVEKEIADKKLSIRGWEPDRSLYAQWKWDRTNAQIAALEQQRQKIKDEIQATENKAAESAESNARQARTERARAYLDDTTNAPKAAKLTAAIDKENKAFKASVAGFAETDAEYIANLKAHNARLDEINASYKDKKAPVDKNESIRDRLRLESRAAEAGLAPETVKELDAIFAAGNLSLTERNRLIDIALSNDRVLAAEQVKVAATAKEAAQATALVNDYRANNQSTLERIAREAELAQMSEKQRLVAEALYKADDEAAKMRERILHDVTDETARTKALADVTAELATQKEKVAVAAAKSYDDQHTFSAGWEKAFQSYEDSATNAAKTAQDAFTGTTNAMEGAVRSFYKNGKVDIEKFGDSVIDMLIDIQMQSLRTSVLAPAMQSAGDWLSSLFNPSTPGVSGGSTASMGTIPPSAYAALTGTYHTGGIVGSEPTASRSIASHYFSNAPRYHTGGIVGDEVPAILKSGEGVFTAGQMRALGVRAQGGSNVTVNVINNADGTKTTQNEAVEKVYS